MFALGCAAGPRPVRRSRGGCGWGPPARPGLRLSDLSLTDWVAFILLACFVSVTLAGLAWRFLETTWPSVFPPRDS